MFFVTYMKQVQLRFLESNNLPNSPLLPNLQVILTLKSLEAFDSPDQGISVYCLFLK